MSRSFLALLQPILLLLQLKISPQFWDASLVSNHHSPVKNQLQRCQRLNLLEVKTGGCSSVCDKLSENNVPQYSKSGTLWISNHLQVKISSNDYNTQFFFLNMQIWAHRTSWTLIWDVCDLQLKSFLFLSLKQYTEIIHF